MVRIIVGQRGWVWIGRLEDAGVVGNEVTVRDAMCIRRWGTTKGLGELVGGPLTGTVLDPVGTLRLHPLNILVTYDVDQGAWERHLTASPSAAGRDA